MTDPIFTPPEDACRRKRCFFDRRRANEAKKAARKRTGDQVRAYRCRECGYWHLTSNRNWADVDMGSGPDEIAAVRRHLHRYRAHYRRERERADALLAAAQAVVALWRDGELLPAPGKTGGPAIAAMDALAEAVAIRPAGAG